jgi:hypothetical protein|tara:strand:+ start:946 stop:1305 length:360 start_codon:yes stop_codon:yes gene_type:complete
MTTKNYLSVYLIIFLFIVSCTQSLDKQNKSAMDIESYKSGLCKCAELNLELFTEISKLGEHSDSTEIIQVMNERREEILECEKYKDTNKNESEKSRDLEYLKKCDAYNKFNEIIYSRKH